MLLSTLPGRRLIAQVHHPIVRLVPMLAGSWLFLTDCRCGNRARGIDSVLADARTRALDALPCRPRVYRVQYQYVTVDRTVPLLRDIGAQALGAMPDGQLLLPHGPGAVDADGTPSPVPKYRALRVATDASLRAVPAADGVRAGVMLSTAAVTADGWVSLTRTRRAHGTGSDEGEHLAVASAIAMAPVGARVRIDTDGLHTAELVRRLVLGQRLPRAPRVRPVVERRLRELVATRVVEVTHRRRNSTPLMKTAHHLAYAHSAPGATGLPEGTRFAWLWRRPEEHWHREEDFHRPAVDPTPRATTQASRCRGDDADSPQGRCATPPDREPPRRDDEHDADHTGLPRRFRS